MKELLKALKGENVTSGLVLRAVETAILLASALEDDGLVQHYLLPNGRVLEIVTPNQQP